MILWASCVSFHLNPRQPDEVHLLFKPVLQMRRWRHRKAGQLVLDHTVSKWGSRTGTWGQSPSKEPPDWAARMGKWWRRRSSGASTLKGGSTAQGKKMSRGSGCWSLNPAPPLTGCVTLGKFLDLCIPQSPHLQNGDNNSLYLKGLCEY